jgi:hypothetical protein
MTIAYIIVVNRSIYSEHIYNYEVEEYCVCKEEEKSHLRICILHYAKVKLQEHSLKESHGRISDA